MDMGNDFATRGAAHAVGKQTLTSSEDVRPTLPGKATLTEALVSSPTADLERVAQRAGERVIDKGKFEYVVQADGSFEIVNVPAAFAHAKGRRITLDALPGVWGILHDLLLAQAPAANPPAPARTASARAPLSAEAMAANDARVRSKGATIVGSTLEIAKTRADLGNAGTHYQRKGYPDAEANRMVAGATDITTFWCSGFSMWTLGAAGYDLAAPVLGSDGKPYTYVEIQKGNEADVTKGRSHTALMKQVEDAGIELANDEYPAGPLKITFRKLIDGHALPVMLMAKVERENIEKGGSLGVYRAPVNGFAGLLDDENHTALAATGAAGAFEALGIGRHIPEAEQKPGDFAQERWTENGVYNGAGHAFQVWTVRAKGNAIFGEKGSPKNLDDEEAKGWKTGATFVISKDTLPALVGEHVVVSATRIEANMESAMPKEEDPDAKQGKKKGKDKQPVGDGGVLITGEVAVPAPKRHTGLRVFYGRLGGSPWEGWIKATPPSR